MITLFRQGNYTTRIMITLALQGFEANSCFLNYKAVILVLKRIFRLDIIEGTSRLPPSLLNSTNPILRLVDTSNLTHLGTFEDFVALCSETTILIVDDVSFLKNVMLMRDKALVIHMHGDYSDPSADSFLKLSDTFSVFMKVITIKDMMYPKQKSFIVRTDEVEQIKSLLILYFKELLKVDITTFMISDLTTSEIESILYTPVAGLPVIQRLADLSPLSLPLEVNIPIVYMLFGKLTSYTTLLLELALRRSSVVVLSDSITGQTIFNKSVFSTYLIYEPMKPFYSGVSQMRRVYKHLHKDNSENKYEYELNCILRWFILRDYMRMKNISRVLMSDTDSAIFASAEQIFATRSTCDATLNANGADHWTMWVASGETSMWTIKALEDFCNFLVEIYIAYISTLQVNKFISP